MFVGLASGASLIATSSTGMARSATALQRSLAPDTPAAPTAEQAVVDLKTSSYGLLAGVRLVQLGDQAFESLVDVITRG